MVKNLVEILIKRKNQISYNIVFRFSLCVRSITLKGRKCFPDQVNKNYLDVILGIPQGI